MSPREMSIRIHNIKQAAFVGIVVGVMIAEGYWYVTNFGLMIDAVSKLLGL